jgi:hypothetical protein
MVIQLYLLHRLQILRNVKVRVRLRPDLCHLHARRQLRQRQLAVHAVDLKHTLPLSVSKCGHNRRDDRRITYQVCDDSTDAVRTRQRQAARLYNLGRAIFSDVARRDHDFRVARIRDKIHCATHAFKDLSGDHVVGEVAIGSDLKGLGTR